MFSTLTEQNPARRWTALVSFTLQAAIVSAALIIPLLYPHSLTDAFAHRRIFAPMRQGDPEAQPTPQPHQSNSTIHLNPLIVRQSTFTFHRVISDATAAEPTQAPSVGNVIGNREGVDQAIVSDMIRIMPRPPAATAPPRVSRMMEGNLVHRVDPQYPVIAKTAGVQGTVVIKAIISRDGAIEHEELVGGPPLLANAALQAVRQWKYRPYYLNGEPMEVETQITVNFVLNR